MSSWWHIPWQHSMVSCRHILGCIFTSISLCPDTWSFVWPGGLSNLFLSLRYADRFAELEKKTGQPKAFWFAGASLFILSIISLLGGMKLMSDLLGFVYPAYMSFKAIESQGTADDTQWLTYWVVFATVSIMESSAMLILEYIPFYFFVKSAFLAWLFHPKFMGAALLYKQMKWVVFVTLGELWIDWNWNLFN